jgi:hypothetical protein
MCPPDIEQHTDEVQKLSLLVRDIPVQPRDIIVLTIRVVVASLRMADFIAGQDHRDTRGLEQGGHEVSLLSRSQCIDRKVFGRSLDATIPAVFVVDAVLIIFAIGVVVFVIVADKIMQRKSVVAGDEVDAGVRLPSIALV